MKTSNSRQGISPALLTLLVALSLVLAGCSSAIPETGGDSGSSVQLDISDSRITAPQEVSSGIVTFDLNNTSQARFSVILTRLNPDVTREQFMSAFEQNPEDATSLVAMVGGRDTAGGETSKLTANLSPGTYVAVGFNDSEVGPPITGTFTVSGDQQSTAAEPDADITVDFVDFAFSMPDTVPAGEQTWLFTNSGTQWHHMILWRLEEGLTQDELLEILQSEEELEGPPPFEQVLDFGPLTQNERAWIEATLEPGTYTALCFLPDNNTGQSHFDLGMIKTFEVTE